MLRPVVLQLDYIEPLSGGFRHGSCPRTCSVATEVNRQFLGQDFHLLDDDAFHGARKQIRSLYSTISLLRSL